MKSYSDYLKRFFPDFKVQKISVNLSSSCPNRDGTIGYGGCIYCRNDSFSPSYCFENSTVRNQIEEGKKFFSRKYPKMKFIAYFQSYTSTYGNNTDKLIKIYQEALDVKEVVALAIGTRPDTLSDSLLESLSEINKSYPVFLEIGAETANDQTLNLINRHHSWQNVCECVTKASKVGLHCGLHLIAGLPGENEEIILDSVRKASLLPIETLKIHHLQILYGTPLYKLWETGEITLRPYELEEYLELCCKIINIIPDHIIIERFLAQSPPQLVAAPKWGLKNYQFMNLLQNKLL